jgi:hypothetical protein
MYFECKEEFCSEDGLRVKGRYLGVDESQGREELIELWGDLMELHGARKLTVSSDKLPAFSGMVRKFEEKLQDKYIMGLWESTLLGDLLWTAGRRTGGTWPPKYRAPNVLSYNVHITGEKTLTGRWTTAGSPFKSP